MRSLVPKELQDFLSQDFIRFAWEHLERPADEAEEMVTETTELKSAYDHLPLFKSPHGESAASNYAGSNHGNF